MTGFRHEPCDLHSSGADAHPPADAGFSPRSAAKKHLTSPKIARMRRFGALRFSLLDGGVLAGLGGTQLRPRGGIATRHTAIWEVPGAPNTLARTICRQIGRDLIADEWNTYLPGQTPWKVCS
jgi:hypothetical protein